MLYLYDVWVNWFEGEEEGYNVCSYHEWRRTDQIEILEQVPVLYIAESLFHHIENSLDELPTTLLEMIHKKAYIRKGHRRQILDYTCIVTDGRGILAFDTIGYQIPIRKSRLIPRQEQQVYELCKKIKQKHFSFFPSDTNEEKCLMAMEQRLVTGLTRKERQLKKLLMIALEQLKTTENISEMKYWLTEWDQNISLSSYDYSILELWDMLYEKVEYGWSEKHEKFCAQLIRGNQFLEKFWELEQMEHKNKENQK